MPRGCAASKACSACPWRRSNQGKPHPDGWYTKKNLTRLWAGLRSADAPGMSCHPTDSDNPVPEGHATVPEGVEKRECAGSLLIVQRELKRFEADPEGYTKGRRTRKLTRAGLAYWGLSRAVFGGTPLGGLAMTAIDEDPDVGVPWWPEDGGS